MLLIFVPFKTASQLFQKIMGIKISPNTLWLWTQELGKRIKRQMDMELLALKNGKSPEAEFLASELENTPLIISADGVMVPLRPKIGTAEGKTIWREVKVGILARYVKRITRQGKEVFQLQHRRLVAVLGKIEIFWLFGISRGALRFQIVTHVFRHPVLPIVKIEDIGKLLNEKELKLAEYIV
jgi:hypothetical protein